MDMDDWKGMLIANPVSHNLCCCHTVYYHVYQYYTNLGQYNQYKILLIISETIVYYQY